MDKCNESNEHPLRNEPGLELEDVNSKRNLQYNNAIRYSSLMHALHSSIYNPFTEPKLQSLARKYVTINKSRYLKLYNDLPKDDNITEIKTMYSMKINIDYTYLHKCLQKSLFPLIQQEADEESRTQNL
jgi:hypothetical protein